MSNTNRHQVPPTISTNSGNSITEIEIQSETRSGIDTGPESETFKVDNKISNDNRKMMEIVSPSFSPPRQGKKSKNLKNLQLNLSKSPIDNSNLPEVPIPLQKYDMNNLNNIPLTPQRCATTPTVIQTINSPFNQPNSLNHFRRVPSFNSPSNTPVSRSALISPSNSQTKRSATTLAINIPSQNIKEDENKTSSSTLEPGGLLSESNVNNNKSTHNKTIPILPFEKPKNLYHYMDFTNNQLPLSASSQPSSSSSRSSSPSSTLSQSAALPIDVQYSNHSHSYSAEIKPQTIMHSFDESNVENLKNTYPNGPICVLEPNLYLYSEPTLEEITGFDVIVNVAQEIKNFSHQINQLNESKNNTEDLERLKLESENKINNNDNNRKIEYYFIPWTHTARLTSDFPHLTTLIDNSLKENKKVLIHCQCGVSRSASLIMAYFMKVFGGGYNEAYGRLKEKVPQISPNLSLIYELIEWGDWLENDRAK